MTSLDHQIEIILPQDCSGIDLSSLRHAVSFHRPWATAVAKYGKAIENRDKESVFDPKEWVAIHASKTFDKSGAQVINEEFSEARIDAKNDPTGIVAIARFKQNVQASNSDWFTGPVGWHFDQVIPLPNPIVTKGYPFAWMMPQGAVLKIMNQLQPSDSYVLANSDMSGVKAIKSSFSALNFEAAVETADTLEKLKAIKEDFSEDFRRQVIGGWSRGQIQWMQEKYKAFAKDKRGEPMKFWHGKERTWPLPGSLIRQTGYAPNNRPIKVHSIDPKGVMMLEPVGADKSPLEYAPPMECWGYWPKEGDRVVVLIKPYLDWLHSERMKNEESNPAAHKAIVSRLEHFGAMDGRVGGRVINLLKNYTLTKVNGVFGQIDYEGSMTVPLKYLSVVKRDWDE